MLVEVFGPFVLNVVPEVSVNRLDLIKLDDLHKFLGDTSNEQVRSIVRRLELAEAMQVGLDTGDTRACLYRLKPLGSI